MRNQKGQLLLTLIIIMTVALAIGLSIIQKSLLDVSTSTKVEQSSRAFSAAEAGVEKYLKNTVDCVPESDPDKCQVKFSDTGSQANVSGGGLKPITVSAGTPQDPLEYPPLAKEDVVQVWMADLTSPNNPPTTYYDPSPTRAIDIFWGTDGNPANDRAALELTILYYEGGAYKSDKKYYDSISRTPDNKFDLTAICNGGQKPSNGVQSYQCRKRVDLPTGSLMLIRARLLYNSTSQPFGVQAVNTCGKSCSFPPQARVLVSTGTSGETQRKVKVFQEYKVVPPYFDYAIFSAGDIVKQ